MSSDLTITSHLKTDINMSKRMKLLAISFMSVIMLCTALTACSGGDNSSKGTYKVPSDGIMGTVVIDDVNIDLSDGWYAEKYSEGDEKIKLYNLSLDESKRGYIEVYVSSVVTGNEGREDAHFWAGKLSEGYGGKEISDYTTSGGIGYLRLRVSADQDLLFTDIDDDKYMQVSCMNLGFDDCKSMIERISF